MSHTKGNWTYRRIEPYGKISGAFTVKTVFMSDYPKISTKPLRTTKFLAHFPLSDEDGEANARLIAAAPDLLEALQGLLADIQDYQRINNLGGENNHWQVISRAAIAKATQS